MTPTRLQDLPDPGMTIEDLLQELLKIDPKSRQQKVVLFDYGSGGYVPLPGLNVCIEGTPDVHLTIN